MASMGSGNQASGPLLEAIRSGSTEVADELVSSVNANSTDKSGFPIISVAIEHHKNDIVKIILLRGAIPDETDIAGRNCIHVAAAEGNADAIQLIWDIEGDLELEAKTKSGNTALHRAAAYGHAECIAVLSKLGANLDAVNSSGETPLIRAARWGHEDCVTVLLKAGASYTHKDDNQMTALAWARRKEFDGVEAVLLNPPRPGSSAARDSDSDDDDAPGDEVGGDDVPDFFGDAAPHEDSDEDLPVVAGSSVAAAAAATHNGAASTGGSTQGSRRSIVGATKYGQPMRVEGWMRKHGGTFRPWRNRFFMLEGRTVWYFANEANLDKAKAKGVVRLVQGSEVLVEDSYSKPYCFNINTPQRKYVVQAANDEEMIEWMEALQNNLDVCPPEMALEEWDDVDG